MSHLILDDSDEPTDLVQEKATNTGPNAHLVVIKIAIKGGWLNEVTEGVKVFTECYDLLEGPASGTH